jgi:hypothetical protein
MANNEQKSEIIIYQNINGALQIKVRLEDETVWLSQAQLAELFQTTRPNITMHIKNIFEEGELEENSVCKDFLHTAADNKRYATKYYNLDLIISLGYRIKSKIATNFRIWATQRLKEYIQKGFTMDDERLKNLGGGTYWKELLERIRDIRSSEKVLYRQVLDLYATSIDYDPKSSLSLDFFKIVQNKLHYATHGQTAAEVIFNRANADKPFMGLTVFSGSQPIKKDISIAKNYLNAQELKILSNLVSGYFDFAEVQAIRQKPMTMADYIKQLDNMLASTGENLLKNAGVISNKKALKKAEKEYKKYQIKTLSEIEKDYLNSIKTIQKEITKKFKK